jgi:hypothetical protein
MSKSPNFFDKLIVDGQNYSIHKKFARKYHLKASKRIDKVEDDFREMALFYVRYCKLD